MNAGRELDKLVYRHILGGVFDPNSSYPWDDIKAYSTNREHAWIVVEKLEKSGMILLHIGRDYKTTKWTVRFGRADDHEREASADTLPLAICLAALAAPVFAIP